MQRWNYRWEPDDKVPHIGPMAQDFLGAFCAGRDDKRIGTLDSDGVALAAIQGLYEMKQEKKDAKIATFERGQPRLMSWRKA